MCNRTAAPALLILSGALLLGACSALSTREVPVVTKVKPDQSLLQLCDEPLRPDPDKSLDDNGEALADLAIKFRECSARQAKLVGWFD
jgi:hypothetical protein